MRSLVQRTLVLTLAPLALLAMPLVSSCTKGPGFLKQEGQPISDESAKSQTPMQVVKSEKDRKSTRLNSSH